MIKGYKEISRQYFVWKQSESNFDSHGMEWVTEFHKGFPDECLPGKYDICVLGSKLCEN